MLDHILIFAASLFANTLSALAGGGAGLVQLPVLIFMGLPFATALATHKIATVALGAGAVIRHLKNRENIAWAFAVYILLCGVFGTVLGAYIIVRVPDQMAELALGLFTIGLGVYSVFKRSMGLEHTPKNRNVSGYVIGGVGLFLIGVLNGSLASGSGLFVTAWLILWFGLDYKFAVMYTMLLVGLFWNASSSVAIIAFGAEVYWAWIPALLAGAFLGGYAGAHIGLARGSRLIKRVFESVTVLSGLYLIMRYFTEY